MVLFLKSICVELVLHLTELYSLQPAFFPMSRYYIYHILIVGGAIRKECSINASSFSDWRWIPYFLFLLFSMLCIPLGWGVREAKISVAGFLKKDDILRSKLFTKLYFPLLTPRFFGRAFEGQRLP